MVLQQEHINSSSYIIEFEKVIHIVRNCNRLHSLMTSRDKVRGIRTLFKEKFHQSYSVCNNSKLQRLLGERKSTIKTC